MNIVNRNPYTRLSHYAWGDSMYVYCFNSFFATFIFDIFLCFRLFAILFFHPYDKYAFLARLRWMCIKIQFFCYFCLALPLFTQNGYYFIRSEFFWMDFVRITYVYIHIYPQNEQRERKHTKNRLLCIHIFVEGMYHYHHL